MMFWAILKSITLWKNCCGISLGIWGSTFLLQYLVTLISTHQTFVLKHWSSFLFLQESRKSMAIKVTVFSTFFISRESDLYIRSKYLLKAHSDKARKTQ